MGGYKRIILVIISSVLVLSLVSEAHALKLWWFQDEAKKKNVELLDSLKLGTTLLVHGHEVPDNEVIKNAKTIIIGHEHPAIGLKDGGRTERLKCFLVGKNNGRDMIIMPSLNLLTEGTDILDDIPFTPKIKSGFNEFKAYGTIEDKILDFGKIKSISKNISNL